MEFVTVLETRGIVNRRDDPSDRRVYVVSLTPAGRRLVSVVVGRVAAVERTLLSGRRSFSRHE